MKLFKNQKGFSDVITVAILAGVIGSIFIGGVFVWKKIDRVDLVKMPIAIKQEDDTQKYELTSKYCFYGNCLFESTHSDVPYDYIVGLTTVKGFYEKVDKKDWGDVDVQCDTFKITAGSLEFINYYKYLDNYTDLYDVKDDISLNIDLTKIEESLKEKITSTSRENKINLVIFQNPPSGKGRGACASNIVISSAVDDYWASLIIQK